MYSKVMVDWFSWTSEAARSASVPFHALPAVRQPHGFLAGSLQANGKVIRYRLYVPATRGSEPPALVVMLHGCGQDAADFALATGMNELAEQAGFLVLYPEQSPYANWNSCWNWFEAANQARDQGEPALVAALTLKIIGDHGVDQRRVSVAGLSAGAAMALIVGRNYPDIFSAIGCHSGMPHGSATSGIGAMTTMRFGGAVPACAGGPCLTSVPVIVFHGGDDAIVHQSNGDGVVRQSIQSYLSARPAGCRSVMNVQVTGQEGGRDFTRSVHTGKSGTVVAEHWLVHGTGHAWSGGDLRAANTDANGPDASREMLRFFGERHAR